MVREITLDESNFCDLPNVVVDQERNGVRICGSNKWLSLGELSSLFVGILSHESIHLVLLRRISDKTSDSLDEIASVSSVSPTRREITIVRKYSHGLIGIELF